MRFGIVAVLFAFGSLPVEAQVLVPSQADVAAAVQRGYENKRCELVSARAKPFGRATGFDIAVMGPLNRVECAAASAAKKYLPFSADSVTPAMLEPVIVVSADPLKPELMSDGWRITPPASHLVLRDVALKDDAPPIQPDTVALTTSSWGNAVGGKFEGTGVVARFKTVSLPPKGVEVVVITPEREYKTKLSAEDVKRIH